MRDYVDRRVTNLVPRSFTAKGNFSVGQSEILGKRLAGYSTYACYLTYLGSPTAI